MGFFQIIVALFFTEDLVVWWWGALKLRKVPVRRGVRLVFHGFFAVQTVTLSVIVYGRAHNIHIDGILPTSVAIGWSVWHLVVAPVALVVSLIWAIGEGIAALVRRFGGDSIRRPALSEVGEGGLSVSRREFLGTAAALTPPVLTMAVSAIAAGQLTRFRIRRMTLNIAGLPRELEGMTIAHVSDTHLGRFTHGRIVKEVVKSTNALKADLVLFSGDLINDELEWLPQGIDMLRAMDAPLVLCEGNHDLIENPGEFEKRVKASGLTLLVNEATTIPVRGVPVQILGLCWGGPPNYGERRHDENRLRLSMAQLMQRRDPSAFSILLAHHPHAWDYAGDVPLTLSGHTHGGQLMVNERLGFGPVMFRYWSGLYTRPVNHTGGQGNGGSQALVVSNGVGNWFPLRTAAPAEIVHLTLRRG